MKKITLLSLGIMLLFGGLFAQRTVAPSHDYPYREYFDEAYAIHPNIPRGLLEAVAWTNTRMRHVQPEQEAASCIGLPGYYGVMGMVHDAQSGFRSNLREAAIWSGINESEVKTDPRKNILAFAAMFEQTGAYFMQNDTETALRSRLHLCSEFPSFDTRMRPLEEFSYVKDVQAYSVFVFLNDPEQQSRFNFPTYNFDLEEAFGAENYKVLSASYVQVSASQVRTADGTTYEPLAPSADYPPALWDPAPSCNYSSRSGTAVSAVTIHTTQGSYAGAINWFKNCASSVSAHYVIRSLDGQVTQMVLEADKAWHVGSENPYTIGIEHEGFVDDPAWYTNEMYTSSADLVRDIVNSGYGIDPLTTYAGEPSTVVQVLPQNCYRIKGHQHFPNQTHVDPGINWDWDRYYRLINDPITPVTETACSGTFYDSGGSGANYGDQERSAWLIAPTGATTVDLTFTAFDLESNYDFLYIYDGDSPEGELLGSFDGTTTPGPFTAQSGAFYLEFRSDCATTRPGWTANWSCGTASPACGTPDGLAVSNLHPFGADISWNTAAGATSYELRYRNSLDDQWTTEPVTTISYSLTGLKASALYYYQVRTLCGTGSSAWAGGSFETPQAADHTSILCSGTFRDSGGKDANYKNSENYTFTIQPTGAGSVTLSFNSFDIESNYDYLYIYDGPTTGSTLIGTYTGTNSPGTVVSSGGALTVKFTSDSWTTKSGWDATWQCVANLAPTTSITAVNEWYADDFTASFTDTDQSGTGLYKRFYQVLEFNDSIWDCNRDNGFMLETFDGNYDHWTAGAGNAYILNDRLHQTDTVTTNTNVWIDAQQGGGARLYTFSARLWSGQTNRRFGIHIFADDGTATNRGNSYLIWFRGDSQSAEIYETVNNVLNLEASVALQIDDFVWYDIAVSYDPATGIIKVWRDGALILSWTDSTPIASGDYVSLRTNQSHCDFENMRMFKERSSTANILIGPAQTEDCRYQNPDPAPWYGRLYSIAADNADNWSNLDFKSFKIDWTPPSDPAVYDGDTLDADTLYSLTAVSLNWDAAIDTNSGITRYYAALGSAAGLDDIVAWTNMGDTTSGTMSGLSLTHGQTYYFSLRAENFSGLFSNDVSSTGFVAWDPPIATDEKLWSQLRMWPNPTNGQVFLDPGVRGQYEVEIRDGLGRLLLQTAAVGRMNIDASMWAGGVYFVQVRQGDSGSVLRLVVR